MDVDDCITRLSEENPGFDDLVFQIATLISSHPPPFIYINSPTAPRVTSSVVSAVLSNLSDRPSTSNLRIRYAHANGVACFTPRLLYDSVLNSLANWKVNWEDGCRNWAADGDKPIWNENLDSFLHGLKAVHADLVNSGSVKGKNKGKNREARVNRMVLLIERAERLKESMPDLIVPLTRLAELSQVDISVIFISDVTWEDIRPPLGASPEPYYIDVQAVDKQAMIRRLLLSFEESSNAFSDHEIHGYHPVLRPLYEHFASMVLSVCAPFMQDPDELAYIAAARWPGFVQPVLDEYHRSCPDIDEDNGTLDLVPPKEDVRMRLIRLFTSSLTAALEALYPRLTSAEDWARDNMPERNLLSNPSNRVVVVSTINNGDHSRMESLPRMSKYILIAAFLASTNPAKSDLRMFGRGLDERKRKRRKTDGTKKSGPANIPRRLLGPSPFPLDRLIAILGVLLEENDVDVRPTAPEFTIPGEYTEMEITRVHVYSSVMQLTSIRLLHRVSPPDKLDGPPTFKCGVSYDAALALSRQVDVPLNDLMWDPA